jgi:hypothetical protein
MAFMSRRALILPHHSDSNIHHHLGPNGTTLQIATLGPDLEAAGVTVTGRTIAMKKFLIYARK